VKVTVGISIINRNIDALLTDPARKRAVHICSSGVATAWLADAAAAGTALQQLLLLLLL